MEPVGITDLLKAENKSEKSSVELLSELIPMQCEALNNQVGTLKYYDCPKCKNKGYTYYVNHENDIVSVKCKCMTIRENLSRIRKSKLGENLERYTFENFETSNKLQSRIKELATEFIKESGKWFFVGGQPGSGKTHICTAITASLLYQGKTARYVVWNDESVRLKALVNDREYQNEIKELKTCEVLYIDDFFKTTADDKGEKKKPTPADIRLAFEIINARYNQRDLITIISSELSLRDIIDIDEAIGSRINERAKGYVINVAFSEDNNYRLR